MLQKILRQQQTTKYSTLQKVEDIGFIKCFIYIHNWIGRNFIEGWKAKCIRDSFFFETSELGKPHGLYVFSMFSHETHSRLINYWFIYSVSPYSHLLHHLIQAQQGEYLVYISGELKPHNAKEKYMFLQSSILLFKIVLVGALLIKVMGHSIT